MGNGTAPFLVQPPFDRRITSLTYSQGAQGHGKLGRGFMIWDKAMPGYKNRARVNFLYNPSTISASYSMQSGDPTAALQWRDMADQAQPHVPLQATVSWALLYDRTFELWGSYTPDGVPRNWKNPGSPFTDPSVSGTTVDILAMEQFTGQLDYANAGGAGQFGGGDGGFGAKTKRQGPMMLAPAWVYFGAATGLQYYGYVADWSVQVTHWTQYMVPMRCVINIDFALFPPPESEAGTGTGVSSWWSLTGGPQPKGKMPTQPVGNRVPGGFTP